MFCLVEHIDQLTALKTMFIDHAVDEHLYLWLCTVVACCNGCESQQRSQQKTAGKSFFYSL